MSAPALGNKSAPHLYRVGVAPVAVELDDSFTKIAHVDVHARTRWSAMSLAEQAGYTVRDCTLVN